MRDLFMRLYKLPPWLLFLYSVIALAIWTVMILFLDYRRESQEYSIKRFKIKQKIKLTLNLILMLLGLTIILLETFVRRKSSENQVILIPMRVLFGLRAPGDYWDVTVMNIVLYVPFACGLCFVMEKKCVHPAGLTILICFILALIAEVLQYIFDSGWTEVDDVLMNTFGGVLGTLPFLATTKLKKR